MANCCRCQTGPTPPVCRSVITSADIAELVYIAGLDENLCDKFQAFTDLFQLTNCDGDLIDGDTPIVTCADFRDQLCAAFAEFTASGSLTLDSTLLVGADCTTYTVPETPITVIDSNCIDFTVSGPFLHTLQADLVISPDAGNQAQCTANGLLVPAAADLCDELAALPFFGTAVPGVTKIVANDCNVYDLPATGAAVVVQGAAGDCADTNVVEAPTGTFTVTTDVVVSPNSDNALSCLGNGLFVNEVQIEGQDTACIDIEVVDNGNGDWTITVDPIISGAEGNILECTPEGLFVPPALLDAVGIDTNCFDFDVSVVDGTITITGEPIISPVIGNALACSELGLFVLPGGESDPVTITGIDTNCIDILIGNPVANEWEITVTPVIDSDPDNILECGVDGLFVPATTVSVADSTSVDLTVNHIDDNYEITAAVIVAPTYTGFPASCNSLVIQGDGLAVPPESTSDMFSSIISGPVYDGPVMFADNFVGVTHTINIDNPSDCRDAILTLHLTFPGMNTEGTPFRFLILEEVQHNINLPAVFSTGGFIQGNYAEWTDNDNTAMDTPHVETGIYQFVLPAGFTGGVYEAFAEWTCVIYDGVSFQATFGDCRVAATVVTI